MTDFNVLQNSVAGIEMQLGTIRDEIKRLEGA